MDIFLDRAIEILIQQEGWQEVSLTLSNLATNDLAQGTRKRDNGDGSAGFLVARDIVVRGVRYGRFEMKLVAASGPTLLAVDCVASQLARFAELETARAEREELATFVQKSTLELAARKLLARASGLFRGGKPQLQESRRAA